MKKVKAASIAFLSVIATTSSVFASMPQNTIVIGDKAYYIKYIFNKKMRKKY